MSDQSVQVVVVVAVAVVVAVMILRAFGPPRTRPVTTLDLDRLHLARGVVLFTSATCATCIDAQRVLDRVLGPGRYVERSWESDADVLSAAGIDEVPLTVVIGRRGVRTVLRGVPSAARLRMAHLMSRV